MRLDHAHHGTPPACAVAARITAWRPAAARHRPAFTLVEMMIAMAIFAGVMAAIVGTLRAITDYSRFGEAQDDLANEGRMALRRIEADLSLSGWYNTGTSLPDSAHDRSDGRYYPFVQIQSRTGEPPGVGRGAGLGQQYPHHLRAASLVALPNLPLDMPGEPTDQGRVFTTTSIGDLRDWRTSFYAPSQELIFLRTRQGEALGGDGFVFFAQNDTDAWRIAPSGTTSTGKNPREALSILGMNEWRRAADEPNPVAANVQVDAQGRSYRLRNGRGVYDVQLQSAFLDPGGELSVFLYWETTEPLDGSTTANPPGLGALPNTYVNISSGVYHTPILREFSFAVLPSRSGLGQLVLRRMEGFGTAPGVSTRPPALGDCVAAAIDPAPENTDTTNFPNASNSWYGMVIDQVLSDNVVRVTFDTVRTARPPHADDVANLGADLARHVACESVDINHVRVRLYLAKRLTGNRSVCKILETVMSLRARSGAVEVAQDRELLTTSTPLSFLPR